MERDRRYIYILTSVFLLGLTVGSIAGRGAEPGLSLDADAGFEKYLAATAAANLPFWCAALIPRTRGHRILWGSAGILVKGALIGCASAFIMSRRDMSWYCYALNILPQLFFTAPLYIFTIAALMKKSGGPYTYSSILGGVAASVLATFLASCIQYLIFVCLYTIQGVFITKI